MIPFIRSLSELTAITESRDSQSRVSKKVDINIFSLDSIQRKKYLRSPRKKNVSLPDVPKLIRQKWVHNKESVSRFIDELDYNNQIQSSYDLILLERQNQTNQKDIA